MNESAVEFRGVTYQSASRPPQRILKDVSLNLAAGSVTAILGRSGSGKTTLMRMVNGLIAPSTGKVLVGARPTSDWNLLELRRHIGYVIQDAGLFPHWTVERNAGLALELTAEQTRARTTASRKQRVAEVLALAGLNPALGARFPWQLSGGQRQRVGLARALAAEPAILLMDEPFGALDPMTRAEMQTMVKSLLARVGTTTLLVTHDLNEALYLSTRLVFLDAGEVVADLAAEDVLQSAIPYVARYVEASSRGAQR